MVRIETSQGTDEENPSGRTKKKKPTKCDTIL